MTERYIVGYDGSGPSRRALAWAIDRAARALGSVLIVHVRRGPGRVTDAIGTSEGADDMVARTAAEAQRRHPDVPISWEVLEGDTVSCLLSVADESDVLVLGTHKTGHLHGRSFGTTGLSLAVGAVCSVVVVPDVDLRFRRGIVAGVGTDPSAATVCETAAMEAERRGDELVLVHAVDGQEEPVPLGTAGGRLQDEHPLVPVSCRTTRRAIAPTLLDAALGHALLVIGAPHPSEVRVGHGSAVLHDVLINLTAPVLVARSRGERMVAGARIHHTKGIA